MQETRVLVAPNQSVSPSVTLYSSKSLEAMLTPEIRRILDVMNFMVPSNVPATPELLAHLRKAAAAHEAALVPASESELTRALALLSTATIAWTDEDERKVKLGMELLKRGLAHVPLDLLNDGIAAYIGKEGRRFFPKSPGELLEFTNPGLRLRSRRATNLRRMHAELERRADEERKRLASETQWTPESTADANATFRRLGIRTRYKYVGGGRVETVVLELGTPE